MWRAFLNQQNLLKQNKLYNIFYLIKKLLHNTRHGFEVSDMAPTALQLRRYGLLISLGIRQGSFRPLFY